MMVRSHLVVLTLSLAGCARPYVRAWSKKYGPAGLLVVGVRSPVFAFEQDLANVRQVEARRMYQLVRRPSPIVDRDLAIEFLDAPIEASSFTFG